MRGAGMFANIDMHDLYYNALLRAQVKHQAAENGRGKARDAALHHEMHHLAGGPAHKRDRDD